MHFRVKSIIRNETSQYPFWVVQFFVWIISVHEILFLQHFMSESKKKDKGKMFFGNIYKPNRTCIMNSGQQLAAVRRQVTRNIVTWKHGLQETPVVTLWIHSEHWRTDWLQMKVLTWELDYLLCKNIWNTIKHYRKRKNKRLKAKSLSC